MLNSIDNVINDNNDIININNKSKNSFKINEH